MMANYLPMVLAPNVLTWLMGLPSRSIDTWEELCRQLINNFKSTCNRPSSEWDLNRIKQREGESLREYIQRFCHKRNSIPDIEERAIIMYFKEGLRDTALFHKLTRKDIRTCEQLFDIANQFAKAEEVILEIQERKRDGQSSHHDRAESSKSQDKKKKSFREVANIKRPRSPKPAHKVRPNECGDFLERKCVIYP